MDPWALLLLASIAVGIAFITSMVGLSGALLFLPVMILAFGVPADLAVGCSLLAGAVSTTTATAQYIRQRKVNYRIGLIYNVVDVPGVLVGAWLASLLNASILAGACGFVIIGLAILILVNKTDRRCQVGSGMASNEMKSCDEAVADSNPELVVARDYKVSFTRKFLSQCFIASFFGGFITGFAGMGGGTADTCSMILIGIPMPVAVGSSVFAMSLTYWFGMFTHTFLAGFDWVVGISLSIGAAIGATLGAKYQCKFKTSVLKRVLCGIAIFAGVQLVLSLFNLNLQ
ncbi:MAG: sulfite exporter TauE/SafE family protein [Candidatus Lokiarchaeota archaeon]|nr:sulfite exporter TauE/SafE family protein [Candidatus Lokiarchaeota archaeon]